MKQVARCLAAAVTTAVTVALAPLAHADMLVGNYELSIPDRYDFHSMIWKISPCPSEKGCVQVSQIPRPNAKADTWDGYAHLANGRYTMTVEDPYGLRCGGVYYGPAYVTHDTYSWDGVTLAGAMDSVSDTGCDGGPGGTTTYPFSLSRM